MENYPLIITVTLRGFFISSRPSALKKADILAFRLSCIALCADFIFLFPIWCKRQDIDCVGSCSLFFHLFLQSYTAELHWLEHWWLVYHRCFELVLESLGGSNENTQHTFI